MNRGKARTSLGMMLTVMVMLTASCTKYVSVPPSDYSSLGAQDALDWEVKTAEKMYRTECLAVNDSSLVLRDAVWVKDRLSANYPSDVWSRMDKTQVPLALRLEQVESVDRVERARTRTILAVASVTAVIVGSVTLLVLYLSGGALGGYN